MNVAVIGAGYVGLPSAGVFARLGHNVWLIRRDNDKVEQLKRGEIGIYEPGLAELIGEGLQAGRIHPTTLYGEAIPQADVVIICVGTPSGERGEADLTQVYDAARSIAPLLSQFTVVVDKSTVPIGTARQVTRLIRECAPVADFAVASCPEFLREGSAVEDTLNPDRIVMGVDDDRGRQVLLALHEGLPGERIMTNVESAEMIKYASNAFLATKISFMNEIARICEQVGADVHEVARGMGADKRIGSAFLRAGIGWGGSCFPKDVRALRSIADATQTDTRILDAVTAVNEDQRTLVVQKLREFLGGLEGKVIFMLGLAFKPHTDDVRESAAIDIIKLLKREGAIVRSHDPVATENARRLLLEAEFVTDVESGFQGADAVVVGTEWPVYQTIPWKDLKLRMRTPILIDGRNMLDPATIQQFGFTYWCIGRP
ncbi:MAG: UDP-glucose/GDP-mannose dehydrogenase family protein [bacterium]|nr:UDP-glucose/GDP-mannose dehydrogenase family protein [bacterium]